MKPFELSLPDRLADAVRLGRDGAEFKAGGIDLIDRLKEGVADPKSVVDLLRLRGELGGIAKTGDGLRLGALVTLQELADAPELQGPAFGALQQAAADAATPQIRSRATLGGNLLQRTRCWYLRSSQFGCLHGGDGPICMARDGENRYHAVLGFLDCVRVHPSNTAPALAVLGAEVEIQGGEDTRRIPIAELWPSQPLAQNAEHTLEPGEVLAAVHLPAARGRSAYRESREKHNHDWATTAAAVRLVVDGGKITDARVCLGAIAPVPFQSPQAEQVLRGEAPSLELFERAARAAYSRATPLSQNAYKVEAGRAVLVDALRAASGME